MILFRFLFVVVFTILVFTPHVSYAADSLSFVDKSSLKNQRIVDLLSSYNFEHFAAVDLNNDSIDEYILKTNNSKQFEVLGMSDEGIISLGIIDAQRLMVSYNQKNGVRSLLGFSDANNDFEYDVYAWDAMKSSFILAQNYDHKGGLQ